MIENYYYLRSKLK